MPRQRPSWCPCHCPHHQPHHQHSFEDDMAIQSMTISVTYIFVTNIGLGLGCTGSGKFYDSRETSQIVSICDVLTKPSRGTFCDAEYMTLFENIINSDLWRLLRFLRQNWFVTEANISYSEFTPYWASHSNTLSISHTSNPNTLSRLASEWANLESWIVWLVGYS